jgi:cysteine desulfurase
MADLEPQGYFDYAASNPLLPEAAAAMAAALSLVGNPSSIHQAGLEVRQQLDQARQELAAWLQAKPAELTFTSGATEANNLAVIGLIRPWLARLHEARLEGSGPINAVWSVLEHSSVRQPLHRLAELDSGLELREARPDNSARLTADQLKPHLDQRTVMVCLTAANNVLGTVQPLAESAALVRAERDRRAAAGESLPLYLLVDAVQAANWLALQPKADGIDALVLSGHKSGGPKGVGLLWLRPGITLEPLVYGGGQESGRRSGTENLPAISGWAAAVRQIRSERTAQADRCRKLRQSLVTALVEGDRRWQVLGAPADQSLPGTVFLARTGLNADAAVVQLDLAGFAVSAGSACDAGQRQAPGVVRALYPQIAGHGGGLRISFGYQTTEAAVAALGQALLRLK